MPTYDTRFTLTAEDRTKAATAAAQANFQRLEASAGRLKTALGAVGGALILRQASKFTTDTLAMAQAIGDTAEKAGLTAEQLQVLRFAADQNGSSAEALDKAMIKLNVSIGEAGRSALGLQSGTSVAGEALKALGINVLDAAGDVRSSADLFPELIDKLAAVQNPAERAALAAQIFGKRIGPELAVLINQGSGPLEAYRQKLVETGALIENDLVQASRALADQFGRVGDAVVENFQRGFLQAFVADYKDLEAAVADPQFVTAINNIGQQFGSAFKAIVDNAPTVIGHLREIRDIVVAIAAARLGTSLGAAFGPTGAAIGSAVGLAAGIGGVAALRAGDQERDAERRRARVAAIEKKRASDSVEAVRAASQAINQRLAIETNAASRSIKIQEDQTKNLKAALEQQKVAYRDATQAVAEALREREAVEKEFADFLARGQQSTGRGPTLLSAVSASNRARQALDAGDPKEALRQAREAADLVDKLRQTDPSANLEIVAGKIAATANTAAQAQQTQAEQLQAQAQQAQATLQDLLDRAKSLETLKVGFDDAAAIAEAAALRASIEAALAANPIVIPVTVASPGAAADIPGRAGGGLIPGSSPHPRADNVLIRATAGEWMIQQPSARYYGHALLSAINQRLISREALAGALQHKPPGYAFGGPIADILTNNVRPRPNLAEVAGGGGLPNAPTTTINLTLPTGQTYSVRADTDTAAALQRDVRLAALKQGKR